MICQNCDSIKLDFDVDEQTWICQICGWSYKIGEEVKEKR